MSEYPLLALVLLNSVNPQLPSQSLPNVLCFARIGIEMLSIDPVIVVSSIVQRCQSVSIVLDNVIQSKQSTLNIPPDIPKPNP